MELEELIENTLRRKYLKEMMDSPEIFECKMQLKEYLPSFHDNM